MKSSSTLLSLVAAVTMTFGFSTYAVQGQCTGDLNGDGQINQADVAQLLANSGSVPFPTAVVPTWATLLEASPDPAVVTDANLRAAIVASGFAWRVRDNAANIEMLLVPAGTFMMGCSEAQIAGTPAEINGCAFDQIPTHQVTLSAFYIGRYEVTQAQWTAKMGSNPSYFVPEHGYPDTPRPVERVSWNMIQGFNTATGLRLPTEAEWEYAYRAATTRTFHSYPAQPNGFNPSGIIDDSLLGNIAWYDSNSGIQTHIVGGKFANGLGLHDMSGNVGECCQDWYGSTYYGSSPLINPTGPATGTFRMVRGGDWYNHAVECRGSERRYHPTQDYAQSNHGFRAARNP